MDGARHLRQQGGVVLSILIPELPGKAFHARGLVMLGPGVGDGVVHRRGARVPGALEPGAGEAALIVVAARL